MEIVGETNKDFSNLCTDSLCFILKYSKIIY